MLIWVWRNQGPRVHSQGLISASMEGFPFQNVWLVNMSPGWKTIQLSTGRLFSNCCWSVCDPYLPTNTHTQNSEACRPGVIRSEPSLINKDFFKESWITWEMSLALSERKWKWKKGCVTINVLRKEPAEVKCIQMFNHKWTEISSLWHVCCKSHYRKFKPASNNTWHHENWPWAA